MLRFLEGRKNMADVKDMLHSIEETQRLHRMFVKEEIKEISRVVGEIKKDIDEIIEFKKEHTKDKKIYGAHA